MCACVYILLLFIVVCILYICSCARFVRYINDMSARVLQCVCVWAMAIGPAGITNRFRCKRASGVDNGENSIVHQFKAIIFRFNNTKKGIAKQNQNTKWKKTEKKKTKPKPKQKQNKEHGCTRYHLIFFFAKVFFTNRALTDRFGVRCARHTASAKYNGNLVYYFLLLVIFTHTHTHTHRRLHTSQLWNSCIKQIENSCNA